MPASKSVDEIFWLSLIATLGCVICTRFEPTGLPIELHHVAESSSVRSHFGVAPLCGSRTDGGHHRGSLGLHGPKGIPWFLSFYKVPHLSEYGLLIITMADLSRHLRRFPQLISIVKRPQ